MQAIGVVDVGSNTVRLSVVEIHPDGAYRVRHEEKAGLRLGARVAADGVLGAAAARDTARVLSDFAWAAQEWGVVHWIAVATAAVRQARDGEDFIRTVAGQSGIPLRVLDGSEEAALGLIGALNTLAERDGYVIDVGGASTEITRFADRSLVHSVSLPWGAVNSTAAFALGGPAPREQVLALEAALESAAGDAMHWLTPQPDGTLICLGGTARTLAKMDRRRRRYPLEAIHNYQLEPEGCRAVRDRLVTLSARERARIPGLGADRADLMAAGSAILTWAVTRTAPRRLVVSGSGLREGMFFSHVLRDFPGCLYPDVLEASTRNLSRLYGLPEGADRRADLAAALWVVLGPLGGAAPETHGLIRAAARLRAVGTAVSFYDWPRHTAYLLREGRLFGCDHRQRLLLAVAAAFVGPEQALAALQPYREVLQPEDDRLAVRMGLCLALAEQVDRQARGRALPVQLGLAPSVLRIVTAGSLAEGMSLSVELSDEFRKWFGRALALTAADGAGA